MNNSQRGFTIFIKSLLLFLYFEAIFIVGLDKNIVTTSFLYLVLLGNCFISILQHKYINIKIWLAWAFLCLIGLWNLLEVGNMKILQFLYLTFGFVMASGLYKKDILCDFCLLSFYLNAFIVLFVFSIWGIDFQIFGNSNTSNNYISVYLILSLLMYYILVDDNKEKINVIHSLVALFICFLAGGRSGFLMCCLLILGILVINCLENKKSFTSLLLLIISLLSIIGVSTIFFYLHIHNNSYRLLNSLLSKGLNSESRLLIWFEYVQSLSSSNYNLIFGSNLDKLPILRSFEGNLHNSFLFLHAYLGIFGIAFVAVMLLYDVYFSLKNSKYVYLLVLIAFIFRSSTDWVFGCNKITPFFICIILYPLFCQKGKRLLIKM